MEIPLQITSRNFSLNEAQEREIRKKAQKLEKFHERITRCRVVVESPHRNRHQGNLYSVNVNLTIPGGELVIRKNSHHDLYVAIRDSFNDARRQLEDFTKRQRGDIKHHDDSDRASICALFPEKGYGFIRTADNQEIYFHRNSVLNRKFSELTLGMTVRFAEESGDNGTRASSVTVI